MAGRRIGGSSPLPNKPPSKSRSGSTRFEYRVWGNHGGARALLAELAERESAERVDDCYLLVDDPGWNAKVRDDALKVKQLVEEDRGFERWVAHKHRSADTAPSPFDDLFDDLGLEGLSGDDYDLAAAIDLLPASHDVRAVFVTKHRLRYRIGCLRAEATDVVIQSTGEVLQTLAIEGDDLDELEALRTRLGLVDEPNTPVHQAIENDVDG
ncbi:MAG: hypothetical protein AAGA93_09285 [Actinomycetota bacterium]